MTPAPAAPPLTVPGSPAATADAEQRRQRQALWAGVLVVLIWGSNFSVQKVVFSALSPGGFLFLRYLILPAAAALLLLWHHGLQWPRVNRADLLAMLKLGLIGHLAQVSLVTYGIHLSTAFSSALILACGPVFTLLILRWHRLEHLRRGQLAGVGVAFLGVLLFLSDKLIGRNWQAGSGDLILLAAAALFSYHTVAAKPVMERHGSFTTMAYAMLLGSVPVVLMNLPAGLRLHWGDIGAALWIGILYSVLVSAFAGWLVWGWVNSVRGVARTAPLIYLTPPVAGFVAWLATGERYTATMLAGAALTLSGVALAQFTSAPRDPVRENPAPVD